MPYRVRVTVQVLSTHELPLASGEHVVELELATLHQGEDRDEAIATLENWAGDAAHDLASILELEHN